MSKIHAAFQKCETSVRRVIAKYCPRPADIDELTHETFLKCYAAEMKAEIKEPERLLLHAARNLALSEVKKKRNTMTTYIEDSMVLQGMPDDLQHDPEQELISRGKLATLVNAISELPADDQKMLIMRKIQNMKYSQIAINMNVSVSTVQKRLAAALLICADRMRELGYENSDFGAANPTTPPQSTLLDHKRKPGWKADND